MFRYSLYDVFWYHRKEEKTSLGIHLLNPLGKGSEFIEIHALSLHSFSDLTDLRRLLSVFGPEERDRVSRLSREEDRLLRIASHLLISTLLGEKLGKPYRELPFGRAKYGKPVLNLPDAPCFNVSRSGSLAVCALADRAVGIDAERLDPLDAQSVRLLLGRSADETADEAASEEELRFFYGRWTMLESWAKAEGTGLRDEHPLSSFLPERDGTLFRARASERGEPPWVIETPEIRLPEPERYALAVCRRPQERPASEVVMIDGNELARRFRALL